MTGRWIGLLVISVALGGSAVVAAQDLLPCQPLAPGARCSATTSGNVWRLDFGAPKPAPASQPEVQTWQWWGMAHRDISNRIMPAPALEVPALLDHPIDCKMAKPVDPTLDTRLVVPHRGGHTLSAVWMINVAPCKSK